MSTAASPVRQDSGTPPIGAPDVSVAVVTHNGRQMALETLRSALAHTGPVAVEWLVADNGSTDSTPDAIEAEFPQVTVLRCDNEGFAAGNNAVLRHARGRYVLLMNPDIEIHAGTFAALVQAMDERPEVGAASVVQRGSSLEVLPSLRRFPSPLRNLAEALLATRLPGLGRLQEWVVVDDGYEREQTADWVCGAFMIVRRETVEQVGLLDERFFLYSEEVDWCLRIRAAGWDIRHLPVMEVVHHEGKPSPPRVAEECHSRLLYARKHSGAAGAGVTRAALLVKYGVRAALWAPVAVLKPAHRPRVRRETAGLGVLLGLRRPPLSTAARGGRR